MKRGWTVGRACSEPARGKVDQDELELFIRGGMATHEIVENLGCHPDSVYRAAVRIFGSRSHHNDCMGPRSGMASRNND